MPDAGAREAGVEAEGRALQGLPRPKSHLPPEEPLSEPAVYLHMHGSLNGRAKRDPSTNSRGGMARREEGGGGRQQQGARCKCVELA